jgi:hypothetical protein
MWVLVCSFAKGGVELDGEVAWWNTLNIMLTLFKRVQSIASWVDGTVSSTEQYGTVRYGTVWYHTEHTPYVL